MVRRRIIVHGRVQGVGFRYSAREQAVALRIGGFVRNADNGTVEIEAEGPEDSLDEFVEWVRTGPRFARVESLDVTEVETAGEHGFRVA